jgi:uncharacterized protein YbjT (DUF2867 family)
MTRTDAFEDLGAEMGADGGLILVTGAKGKTGARVIERLWSAGGRVRAGSRTGEPAFDWEDRSTWTGALDGVEAVYVAYQPDLAAPGALEVVTAFFAQAEAAGVKRVVLLSGRGEPEALDAEDALKATGMDWTIIRASWFFQNFSEGVFLDGIRQGALVLPEGLEPEPFVDAEDIAEIAAEAFTDRRHSRKLYEVTGPRAIPFTEAAAAIGRSVGQDVATPIIPLADYRAGLGEAGLPDGLADLIIYLFTTVLDGRNTPLAHGVREALGREPAPFEAYVARTAASGVWEVEQ